MPKSPGWFQGTILLPAIVALGLVVVGCGKDQGRTASDEPGESADTHQEVSSELPPPQNQADRVLAGIIGHFESLNQTFDEIKDEESARQRVPEIEKIVNALHVSLTEGQTLNPDEKSESTERYRSLLDAQTQRFGLNLARITQIPGASAPVIAVLDAMPSLPPPGTPPSNHIDLANPPGHSGDAGDGHEGHGH